MGTFQEIVPKSKLVGTVQDRVQGSIETGRDGHQTLKGQLDELLLVIVHIGIRCLSRDRGGHGGVQGKDRDGLGLGGRGGEALEHVVTLRDDGHKGLTKADIHHLPDRESRTMDGDQSSSARGTRAGRQMANGSALSFLVLRLLLDLLVDLMLRRRGLLIQFRKQRYHGVGRGVGHVVGHVRTTVHEVIEIALGRIVDGRVQLRPWWGRELVLRS